MTMTAMVRAENRYRTKPLRRWSNDAGGAGVERSHLRTARRTARRGDSDARGSRCAHQSSGRSTKYNVGVPG